jgi:hypothetical protein
MKTFSMGLLGNVPMVTGQKEYEPLIAAGGP